MEICEKGEAFVEESGDLVFDHTKIIVRAKNDELFYARVPQRQNRCSDIDLGSLDLVKIPVDHVWPEYDQKFTKAPEPLPENTYIKEPSLLSYGDTEASLRLDQQVSNEAEACEILRQNPHPNIARYWGCVVRDGRIRGLCFTRYPMSLTQQLRSSNAFNPKTCLEGIKNGVAHLHSLGLVHNDLNPANIMMDGDTPVIIDFDSCKPSGVELGLKAGTIGWSKSDLKISEPENDHYGLAKLGEWLSGMSPDKQTSTARISSSHTEENFCT